MKPLSIAICIGLFLSMAKFGITHTMPVSSTVSLASALLMCLFLIRSK